MTLISVDRELLICLSWTKKISRSIQFSLFTDFYILRSPCFWRISISIVVHIWGDALHLIQKDIFSDSKKSKINDTKITKETFFSTFSFLKSLTKCYVPNSKNILFYCRKQTTKITMEIVFMFISLTSIVMYALKQKETNKIFLRREVPFISIFDNRFMWLSSNK